MRAKKTNLKGNMRFDKGYGNVSRNETCHHDATQLTDVRTSGRRDTILLH